MSRTNCVGLIKNKLLKYYKLINIGIEIYRYFIHKQ